MLDEDGKDGKDGKDKKVKVVRFELMVTCPEDIDDDKVLDIFAEKVLVEAATITSNDIEINSESDVRLMKSKFEKTDLKNLIWEETIKILEPLEGIGKYKGNAHHLAQDISEKLSSALMARNVIRINI